jgi:hypothetical protein
MRLARLREKPIFQLPVTYTFESGDVEILTQRPDPVARHRHLQMAEPLLA